MSSFARFCQLRICLLLMGMGLALDSAASQPFKFSMTPEGVHRKVFVTTDNTTLYRAATGEQGKTVGIMSVFFVLDGAAPSDRIPVAQSADTPLLDGWLAKASIMEWNTLHMLDFANQVGRSLVEAHTSSACAAAFAKTGTSELPCKPIGREIKRVPGAVDQSRYEMLIPALKAEQQAGHTVFDAGFVTIPPKFGATAPRPATAPIVSVSGERGYDLVLVIDSTSSMQAWFRPTMEAVAAFAGRIQEESGRRSSSVRIGLIFYRDRLKSGSNCLEYVTQWRVRLGKSSDRETIDHVMAALSNEKEASCSSEDWPEAVWDGLYAALTETEWRGALRLIALIGDAQPHDETDPIKNPLRLGRAKIHQLADARSVRFLSVSVLHPVAEPKDRSDILAEFQRIAEDRPKHLMGRFRSVDPKAELIRQSLESVLWSEWSGLLKVAEDIVDGVRPMPAPPSVPEAKLNFPVMEIVEDLVARMRGPQLSRAWVPLNLAGRPAMKEHVLMSKRKLDQLTGILAAVSEELEKPSNSNAESLIRALKTSLATQIGQGVGTLFGEGDSLSIILHKSGVLPFKSIFFEQFSKAEIEQWRPLDYREKSRQLDNLRDALSNFGQAPENKKLIGGAVWLFVPLALIP